MRRTRFAVDNGKQEWWAAPAAPGTGGGMDAGASSASASDVAGLNDLHDSGSGLDREPVFETLLKLSTTGQTRDGTVQGTASSLERN